jgi:hypothetical protein
LPLPEPNISAVIISPSWVPCEDVVSLVILYIYYFHSIPALLGSPTNIVLGYVVPKELDYLTLTLSSTSVNYPKLDTTD